MSAVHLVVKGVHYDKIDAGTKTVEYRDNTRYWRKRLIKPLSWPQVTFHRGYTKTTMTYKITKILTLDPIEIHLGARIR